MKFWASLAVALILCANTVSASDEEFWVLVNPEPPIIQVNEQGKLVGYPVEYVKGVLKHAGIQQQILAAPWQRILKEATEKSNVLVFSLARTSEREEHYHWIAPITSAQFGIFSKHTTSQQFNNLSELTHLDSVSVLRGDFREELLNSVGVTTTAFDNWADAIKAMLNNNSDGIFFSDIGLQLLCSANDFDCADVKRIYPHSRLTTYLVLSKPGTDPAFAEKLKAAAQEFVSSAEFIELTKQWLSRLREKHNIPVHIEDNVFNFWNKQ